MGVAPLRGEGGDVRAPPGAAEARHAAVPGARLMLVLAAGHDVNLEAPRTAAALTAQPYRVSVSFGRTTQNSFPSGSARTVQDSAPVCPMSTRRAPSARRRSIS